MSLQRLAVDFAAESSFEKAAERFALHHGINLSPSTLRKYTLLHAENIARAQTPGKGVSILPLQGGQEFEVFGRVAGKAKRAAQRKPW